MHCSRSLCTNVDNRVEVAIEQSENVGTVEANGQVRADPKTVHLLAML
jgi:hypothetical protein